MLGRVLFFFFSSHVSFNRGIVNKTTLSRFSSLAVELYIN